MRQAALLSATVMGAALSYACPSTPPAPTRAETAPTPVDTAAEPPPLTLGTGLARPAYEHYTLPNGLDVWLFPDQSAPLAVVQVWVRAGSADEYETRPGATHGTTGLAHFFEHLMFQGTARFPNYDDALTPLGAQNNAFTYQDATAFWVQLPKQHLRLVLDMEADRFRHLKVDFLHFEPEREVVKGERRRNTDADALAVAEERATRNAYDRGPYRWGTIGWKRDLDAVTLAEAQAFHTAHYNPGGAFLVIVGAFDAAETKRWITELWGDIPGGEKVDDRATPPVETWVGPRTDYVFDDTPTTQVVWAYRAPAGTDVRDYAALELIDYILTNGKAGRLQKRLVFGDAPLLSRLGASLFAMRDPYIYVWHAELLEAASASAVEAAIDAELTALGKDGPSADELQSAAASLRLDVVRGLLSQTDRADAFGFSIRSTGAPFSTFDRLDVYPTLTPADIAAVARKYLVPEVRSRVVVVQRDRLTALATAWEAALPGQGLGGNLTKSAAYFADVGRHAVAVADAEREEVAIALLAQRADVAKAERPSDGAAIVKYLSENESGTKARKAALTKTRAALAAEAKTLEATRKALLGALEKLAHGAASSSPSALAAARLLLAPPDTLAIPVPPSEVVPDLRGAEQLALQVVSAHVLSARGLAQSAETARQAVLRLSRRFVGERPPFLEAAVGLATDTSVSGMPLVDLPLQTVRPTRSSP